jgi:phosphinothricin acetyltransferase
MTNSAIVIRDMTVADLSAVAAIYNANVVGTTTTWNSDPVDVADRQVWLAQRLTDGYPVLSAEIAGAVAGYATYGQWRPFTGYLHTVENSVFVADEFQRRGVASALMTELLSRAETAGVHVMIAGIDSSNTSSIALHEKFGFQVAGEFSQVGWKFGRWLDLTLMQLTFGRPGLPPTASRIPASN